MRLPQPDPKTLNPEQRALWDMIAGGPRGGVRGPYFALLHAPKLCAQVEALARFLRFECSIPQRLRELVILVTGRRWNAEYEWFAHEPFAQKHGVSQAVIDAYATLDHHSRSVGRKMGKNDLWIAATALALGATLVSRDLDFREIPGLAVIPL